MHSKRLQCTFMLVNKHAHETCSKRVIKKKGGRKWLPALMLQIEMRKIKPTERRLSSALKYELVRKLCLSRSFRKLIFIVIFCTKMMGGSKVIIKDRCRPSMARRCIPDVVLKEWKFNGENFSKHKCPCS